MDELADYPEITNFKIKFWATGMVDELIPSGTGDLNDDGIINVVDVVALVSIILGDGA